MDDQVKALSEKLAAMETQLSEAKTREAQKDAETKQQANLIAQLSKDAESARLRMRESDADRLVEKYSSAQCLKVPTAAGKAAFRALVIHASSVEGKLTFTEGDTTKELTVLELLTKFVEALPDHKMKLKEVGNAPDLEHDDEPATLMEGAARIATERKLDFSKDDTRRFCLIEAAKTWKKFSPDYQSDAA